MYPSVLVPLDGSTCVEKILPHATEIGRWYGAEIILLKVDEREEVLGHDEVVDADRYVEDRERRHSETQACRAKNKSRLANVRAGNPTLRCRVVPFAL
jgi:nucleotide-binding universal stress UspA family protein